MIRRYLPKNIEELIHWYERYVSPFALIGGFLLDTFFLLDRVDSFTGNLLLLSYLAIAAFGIALLNIVESGRWRSNWMLVIVPFIPVVVQFAFGALFSAYLSLFGRSAGPIASWIFVIVIAGLLIGNERFRALYQKPQFQISILFVALFSFLIFFLPIIFSVIGPWMFMVSGAVSLTLIVLFIYLLRRVAPETVQASFYETMRSIAIIYVAFHVLYLADLIPPLPLALKESGVYHKVERRGFEYQLLDENRAWYTRLIPVGQVFHRAPGEPAYVFTAVFAPTGLHTTILHEWQRYDERTEEWKTEHTFSFDITGGRDGGYRGYSIKSDLQEGDWRVNVLTAYGQTIGRVSFRVENVPEKPLLEILLR